MQNGIEKNEVDLAIADLQASIARIPVMATEDEFKRLVDEAITRFAARMMWLAGMKYPTFQAHVGG